MYNLEMKGVSKMLNLEQDVERLTKAELGAALALDMKEIRMNKKAMLIEKFLAKYNNEFSKRMIYKKYARQFAIHPLQVQKLLGITMTERKRWTKQGKLAVNHYESFNKWGKQLEYPMYNALELSGITDEMISMWREEHTMKVRNNRKKAAEKIAQTKQINQLVQKNFYEKEWKELLFHWYRKDEKLGATLQLSFWTMWINRWAKEYQIKAHHARRKAKEYTDKKEQFYSLKIDAIKLLVHSPYMTLTFYIPPLPHKILDLHFCPHHNQLWSIQKEYGHVSKWDFFTLNEMDIEKCKDCSYGQVNHYYSLYHLSLNSDYYKDYPYSFHVPYPIGSSFLPAYHVLEKGNHHTQEDVFRFGRSLFNNEKVIFKEQEVIKYFKEAKEKYLLYFPELNKGIIEEEIVTYIYSSNQPPFASVV